MARKRSRNMGKISPAALLLISFCLAIFAGAVLLSLPLSTNGSGISPLDALFTATSAVCVTGLIVVDTGSAFTLFGQSVILVLIQLGGLGIMTISVTLFLFIGRRVPFKQRLAMQDVFAHTPRDDIFGLVKSVFIYTFLIETAGVALLFWQFAEHYPLARAFYLALFHSVSAFCNAGFCLFSDSLMAYRDSYAMNFTVGGLIVLGGIGFPVVYELYLHLRGSGPKRVFSLHFKLVLVTTAILITAGTVIYALLEETRSGVSFWSRGLWLPALFQSISARTAGFNTVDIAALGSTTLTFMTFLMFFGASPGSCGGGIKTTTLAVLWLYSIERLRGGDRVSLFKRTVPMLAVDKAVSLFMLAVTLILLMLFVVLVVQEPRVGMPDVPRHFLAYLFEVVSAFGTVGLSMGVTTGLEPLSKLLMILLMLIGRVGVPTLTYLLLRSNSVGSRGFHYAEERIMLG